MHDLLNKKRTAKKSTFRKVVEWLHLWLGLFSGITVFIVCITGALWVFRYEVWYFTESYQRVPVINKPLLPPSVISTNAARYMRSINDTGVILKTITYGKPGTSAIAYFEIGATGEAEIYFNPYTGEIIKDKREESTADKFFTFVRAGHRFLWLSPKIGSPIVGSGCLVFLVIMITGLLWWYPKKWNRANRRKSFTVKWKARWKRLNVDLHNVLGFYALLLVLLMTITGIVITFHWFDNGVYRTLTWKPSPTEVAPPASDTTLFHKPLTASPVDSIWNQTLRMHPDFGRLTLVLPVTPSDTYQSMVFFGDGTIIYNKAQYYFDRFTLKLLPSNNEEDKPYNEISAGEKAYRMNFDIHTGQILGLPGKILAFLACIIGASLPVTGFLIWWGKRKKATISKN